MPELVGRRKISLSQAGAKTNESIEKHLFYTDENPTILDRVNTSVASTLESPQHTAVSSSNTRSHFVNSRRSASCQVRFLTMLRLFEIPFSFVFGGMPVN